MKCDPFEHAIKMLDNAVITPKQPINSKMPYPGEKYNFLEDDNYYYVEGWYGDMVINKIIIGSSIKSIERIPETSYAIINPIVNKDASFYAVISKQEKHGDKEKVCDIVTNCKIDMHNKGSLSSMKTLHYSCFHTQVYGIVAFEKMREMCLKAMRNISAITTYHINNNPKSVEHQNTLDAILRIYHIGPITEEFNKYFRPLL